MDDGRTPTICVSIFYETKFKHLQNRAFIIVSNSNILVVKLNSIAPGRDAKHNEREKIIKEVREK